MLCCARVNWSWKSPLLVWWMTLITLINSCYIEIILVWNSAQEDQEYLRDPSSGWCLLVPNTLKLATYCCILHAPLSCPCLLTQGTRVTKFSIPHTGVRQNTCEGMYACLLSEGYNWGQWAVKSPKMLHGISLRLTWVLISFQYTSRFAWTRTTISSFPQFLLVFCLFLLFLLYIHLWNVSG